MFHASLLPFAAAAAMLARKPTVRARSQKSWPGAAAAAVVFVLCSLRIALAANWGPTITPSFGAGCSLVAFNRTFVAFGGGHLGEEASLGLFDADLGVWTTPTIIGGMPRARVNHCALRLNDKQMLMMFGASQPPLSDPTQIYLFDVESFAYAVSAASCLESDVCSPCRWTSPRATGEPLPAYLSGNAAHLHAGSVVVLGGVAGAQGNAIQPMSVVRLLDVRSFVWSSRTASGKCFCRIDPTVCGREIVP